MCGINGFIQINNREYNKNHLKELVHCMNNTIIHRGPNSEGIYADEMCSIGMRRLSIIDLKGGEQPIWSMSGEKVIVFNGELYNYRELRSELIRRGYKFKTASDTEVVVNGYEEYGVDFFSKMEGMYGFCIYDIEKREILLARDRIGEKPLYYTRTDDAFIFSSELKGIISTGKVLKKINQDALSYYFQLTYIPAPMSILENVYKLPAASYLVFDFKGNISIESYWSLEYQSDNLITDYSNAKKMLRDAMFSSVEKRMISDVPLGAFLSGGIDSTIIVGIMSQLSATPVETFTIGFKDKKYDESDRARQVADMHKTNHHVLQLDWNEAKANLPLILNNIDEPFADSSLIATYMVSKMTKQHVTVALTGDAGDELFAGYNKYLIGYYVGRYKKIPPFIRNGIIKNGLRILPSKSSLARKAYKVASVADKDIYQQRKDLMSLGFKSDEISKLLTSGYVSEMEMIHNYYTLFGESEEQTRAQYLDLKVVLEGDMLPKVDRASMLASLETRVPMLDSNVVELAFQMPAEFKIQGKKRKIILKETFKDLIPNKLLTAPKKGFAVPIAEWLSGDLKEQLFSYADREYLEAQGIFNPEYIRRIIDMHVENKGNMYSELWAFYVFQNWYDRYISSDIV